MKNLTPRQVALICSSSIAFALLIINIILKFAANISIPLLYTLALPLVIFAIGYLLFLRFMERFIYRKIKLIYKQIHDKKSSTKIVEEKIDLNEDLIAQVGADVEDWVEDQSSEMDKLKKSEEFRKDFIGNVSHELKTPIFNIQGFVDTLIDGALYDEKVNMSYLHKTNHNIDRLINIVEDLTTITQFESGQMGLDVQRFDINELTKEIMDSMELQADSEGIELLIKEGCDKPFYVNADKEQIRQVLTNLITNSIKYGIDNGKTQVGFYDMDKNVLIEVADNGIGIAEHHLPRLFERFYRIDKGRSRMHGGTGLGLAIVKHILEAHGHNINVRSTQGKGSTFGFTLEKG